jgi:bZIP transcription factor
MNYFPLNGVPPAPSHPPHPPHPDPSLPEYYAPTPPPDASASALSTLSSLSAGSGPDLGTLPLPELLYNINPALMGEFNMQTPTVLAALMRLQTGAQTSPVWIPSPSAPQSEAAVGNAGPGPDDLLFLNAPTMPSMDPSSVGVAAQPDASAQLSALLAAQQQQMLALQQQQQQHAHNLQHHQVAANPNGVSNSNGVVNPNGMQLGQQSLLGQSNQPAQPIDQPLIHHTLQQPIQQHIQHPMQQQQSQPILPVDPPLPVDPRMRIGLKRAKAAPATSVVKGEAVLSAAAAAGAAAGAASMGHSGLAGFPASSNSLHFSNGPYADHAGNSNGSMGTVSQDGGALSMGGDEDGEEGDAGKRAMRAERNRQSAAASRERKKHHIKELERRVSMLSAENAQLQVGQLDTFRQRIAKERELNKQNRELRERVVRQDMKIHALSKQLQEASVNAPVQSNGDVETLKRPSTWSHSDWGKASTPRIPVIAPWASNAGASAGNSTSAATTATGASVANTTSNNGAL